MRTCSSLSGARNSTGFGWSGWLPFCLFCLRLSALAPPPFFHRGSSSYYYTRVKKKKKEKWGLLEPRERVHLMARAYLRLRLLLLLLLKTCGETLMSVCVTAGWLSPFSFNRIDTHIQGPLTHTFGIV